MEEKEIKTRRTKVQMAEIKKTIYGWMIQGWSNIQIVNKLINDYGFKQDNAYRTIKLVYKDIAPANNQELSDLKNKYIDMYHKLYQDCLDSGDTRGAAQILKNMTDLQGMNVQKVEAKVENIVVEF